MCDAVISPDVACKTLDLYDDLFRCQSPAGAGELLGVCVLCVCGYCRCVVFVW